MKKYIVGLLIGTIVGVGLYNDAFAKTADPETQVNIAFKPHNGKGLTHFVYDTVTPSSQDYHNYLTPQEFARNYGQSAEYINGVKKYFKKYKLNAKVYSGNLAINIQGKNSKITKAFHAVNVKGKHGIITKYKLPSHISKNIIAVIGVYETHNKNNNVKKSKFLTHFSGVKYKNNIPTSNQAANVNIKGNKFSQKYGADKFAHNYQLDKLYNKGLSGQGQRIGLMAVGDFRLSDIKAYWKQNGINTNMSRIHKIYAAGNKQAAKSSLKKSFSPYQLETTLDVQSASSVAPKANIDVYLVQENSGTGPSAAYTSFFKAISDNKDHQISTSYSPALETAAEWGDSSSSLKQYNRAFNLMLEQASAQGITVFSASGDSGRSETGNGKESHGVSTSPYQVLVGGTTLPHMNIAHGKVFSVAKERAWGNIHDFSAGGGGFSALNGTPRYQKGISGVNTFNAITLLKYKDKQGYILNKNPQFINGKKQARNIPDVSGNADPDTGYALYVSSHSKKQKKDQLKSSWMVAGGTSFTSPQIAAANAVMNSGRVTPVGFWNPQIYRYAQQKDTPFHGLDDMVNNNNLYYTGQPGKIYNQATGLGTINFAKLDHNFEK